MSFRSLHLGRAAFVLLASASALAWFASAAAAAEPGLFESEAADAHVSVEGAIRVLDEGGEFVETGEADLNSRVEIELVVTTEPGVEARPIDPATLMGPDVLMTAGGSPQRTERNDGAVVWRYEAEGVPVSVGSLKLPVVTVFYDDVAGGLDGVGRLDAAFEAVVSVAEAAPGVGATDEAGPSRGAADAWFNVRGAVLIAVGALVAVAAAVAIVLVARRRFARRRMEAPVSPTLADEAALSMLADLEHAGLLERQEFEGFAARTADVLRWYIGARFELRAPEMTTPEFLRAAERSRSIAHESATVGEFLERCDMLKFAAVRSSRDEALAAFDLVRGFVLRNGAADASSGDDEGAARGDDQSAGSGGASALPRQRGGLAPSIQNAERAST